MPHSLPSHFSIKYIGINLSWHSYILKSIFCMYLIKKYVTSDNSKICVQRNIKLICAMCKSLNLKNLSVFRGGFKCVSFSPCISHMSENNNKTLNSSLYSFPISFAITCFCLQYLLRLKLLPCLLDTHLPPLQSYPGLSSLMKSFWPL